MVYIYLILFIISFLVPIGFEQDLMSAVFHTLLLYAIFKIYKTTSTQKLSISDCITLHDNMAFTGQRAPWPDIELCEH